MWPLNLRQYQFANWDASGDPIYIGYVDKNGKWYIREINLANGTSKMAIGSAAYATNWADRDNLTYGYFNEVI